ncbi:Copia protein [Vitis vinifera]|uniref:Copia protein n=1 Tax=Vitis vinifera TaxID=29760 RepID=A0A438GXS0_VITVI|nr:Copia protein [Vitis vinifera]
MMEDSPCESFEPLDLHHVSTHGDEEPVSSPIPTSVTRNFPQFPKVYSREKVIPEQKQVQESNSDPKNEITVRSNPPLHTQPGETSTDSTDNLDLDLPIADVVREEMGALEKNETWEIVERLKRKNIIDCKWIFTLKYKIDGSLERHKTRLLAKGYTQTYGVDYQETFALVAKMNIIYMNIPPGFEGNTGNKMCKLKKALYGLKQSLRAWFGRFAKVMKESGYKQSQGNIGCKPFSILMVPNQKLGEAKEEPVVDKKNVLEAGWFPSGSKINYKIILGDLRIKWDGPMKLYCDNKSAINIVHNPIQHNRTKHIEIDRHFIKEKLEE